MSEKWIERTRDASLIAVIIIGGVGCVMNLLVRQWSAALIGPVTVVIVASLRLNLHAFQRKLEMSTAAIKTQDDMAQAALAAVRNGTGAIVPSWDVTPRQAH
jgi:hypothetical protein